MLALGQSVRSLAMVHAGAKFDYVVRTHKIADHDLDSTSVYTTFLHPSNFGFNWWVIVIQSVLGNTLSLVAHSGIMHCFFKYRIECKT
jgi:protein-S-isoprenylcysteine O-methyltransferase